MESSEFGTLLDESGNPLSARIQRVLQDMLPRFRKHFATLDDDVIVTEILEEAGRLIANRERECGPVENLPGYAWVVVRNVARSRMRSSSMRLARATLGSEESQTAFQALQSQTG